MLTRQVSVVLGLLLNTAASALAAPEAYNVKVLQAVQAPDRRLFEEDGVLTIDADSRALVIKAKHQSARIPFDDVDRIVFDVNAHMRGGNKGSLLFGIVGALTIDAKTIQDYWCYISYTSAGSHMATVIELPKDVSGAAKDRIAGLFPGKTTAAELTDKVEAVAKDSLDTKSKFDLTIDPRHPLPEPQPDKALVIVMMPGTNPGDRMGRVQFRVFVNGRVAFVNRMGTYCFAYLDPGDHIIASRYGDGGGLRMTLDAGQSYYLFDNIVLKGQSLSRQTKELAMFEMDGLDYADWKVKGAK